MLLLEVISVSLTFNDADGRPKPVLKDISLRMDAGESLALIGASGSGKTSLARCIAGLIRPTSGSVNVRNTTDDAARRASPVQMLFQNHTASLDPLRTVRESLCDGLEAARVPGTDENIEPLLRQVALPRALLDRLPTRLSGGERQRVALARALAARPSLLVADEPTSALDRLTAEALLDVLHEAVSTCGVGLLHVTHDLAFARRTCSRVAVITEGSLAACASWEEAERQFNHR